MADDLDLTDYVNVAAEAYWDGAGMPVKWAQVTNVDVRESILTMMIPVAQAILDAYRKNNPEPEDTAWLEIF